MTLARGAMPNCGGPGTPVCAKVILRRYSRRPPSQSTTRGAASHIRGSGQRSRGSPHADAEAGARARGFDLGSLVWRWDGGWWVVGWSRRCYVGACVCLRAARCGCSIHGWPLPSPRLAAAPGPPARKAFDPLMLACRRGAIITSSAAVRYGAVLTWRGQRAREMGPYGYEHGQLTA